jgi:hypothetical protein
MNETKKYYFRTNSFKILFMGKKYLSVFLFIILLISSSNLFAQCKNPVKGRLAPIVAHTNTFEGNLGELNLIGYKPSEGITFPCYFEWRKETEEGTLLKKGVMNEPYDKEKRAITSEGKMENLSSGKYVLVTYDSSPTCKKSINTFEIK